MCVCVGGGGGGGGGLSERVYVHVSRYYVHLAKFMGEIMSSRTKMSRGILSYTQDKLHMRACPLPSPLQTVHATNNTAEFDFNYVYK